MENDSGNKLTGNDANMAESYSGKEKSEKKNDNSESKKPSLFEGPAIESDKDAKGKEATPKLFEKSEDADDASLLENLGLEKEDSTEDDVEVPADPEQLSEGEERVVAEQLAEGHQEEVHAALAEAEPDSEEEALVSAEAILVDKLHEKAQEKPLDRAVVQEAVAETASELEVPTSIEADSETVEETEPEDTTDVEGGAEEPVATESAEVEDDDEALPPVATSTFAGGSVPPVPPVTPPMVAGGGMGPVGGGNTLATTPDTDTSTTVIEKTVVVHETNRNRRGADLLIGGVIGYLIGRRRGRIKTEERLLPIQKSLEKKVKTMDQEIELGRQQVRKLTAEKIAREGEDAKKVVTDKLEAKVLAKTEAAKAHREKFAEQAAVEVTPAVGPETVGMAAAAVAAGRSREQMSPTTVERKIFAAPTIEQSRSAVEASHTSIENMPTTELLQIAAKIELAGTNAKVLFEQGRIEKQDLQVVVQEFMRGSGRHETLLIEKLRPPRASETAERLTGPGGSQDPVGAGPVGGNGSPVFSNAPVVPRSGQPVSPAMAAAENRLAQARLESKQHSHMPTVVMLIAFVLLVIVATALVF